VGDAVVRHRFGVMARKSVTRMRGQGSDSERRLVWLVPYLCRSEEAEKRGHQVNRYEWPGRAEWRKPLAQHGFPLFQVYVPANQCI
jgi:hypothetical protein